MKEEEVLRMVIELVGSGEIDGRVDLPNKVSLWIRVSSSSLSKLTVLVRSFAVPGPPSSKRRSSFETLPRRYEGWREDCGFHSASGLEDGDVSPSPFSLSLSLFLPH